LKLRAWKPNTYLYIAGSVGLFLFLLGVALGVLAHSHALYVAGVASQALGSAVLFPVAISLVYDRLRERWLGDAVWRIFGELADAGITRVYRDREAGTNADNAQVRLKADFHDHDRGLVRMMGVSLRVFFNPIGPFFEDLQALMRNTVGDVAICALTSDPISTEALERAAIEEPGRRKDVTAQIVRDIESTVASVQRLVAEHGPRVELRQFKQAPYCTAILFPHVAYFAPNILAPIAPVRLPMILFRHGSHAYQMLELSFQHLWDRSSHVVPPDARYERQSRLQAAIEQRILDEIQRLRTGKRRGVRAGDLLEPLFRDYDEPAFVQSTLMALREKGVVDWDDDDDGPSWIDNADVYIRFADDRSREA
jgi:hypothetical protein